MTSSASIKKFRFSLTDFVYVLYFLLIFSLGFMQPSALIFEQRISFTDFIFLFAFTGWLILLTLRRMTFRWSLVYLPFGLYLFAFVCSVFFSVNFKASAIKLLGEVYLIGLAVLTFNLITTFENFKKVFIVWFSASFLVAFVSLISLFLFYVDRTNWLLLYTLSHYGTLPPGNYPRVQSTFLNPNMLCNYLSVSFLFLLASYKLGWLKSFVFFSVLILISIACLLTLSPGLGGIFLTIGLWWWLIFKQDGSRKLARTSLINGIALAIFFFFAILVSPVPSETSPFYFKTTFSEKRLDPSSRVLAWQTAFQTFLENPFFGKGVGTDVADAKYLNPSGTLETLTDAHQMWLNVAGQTGLLGLFALCFLCVFFLRRMTFNFANQKMILRTALSFAFSSAFLYQGLAGSFEEARHVWVLLGLLASVGESDFPNLAENI